MLRYASYFIPAVFLIWFVTSAYVEIPMLDQWKLVHFFDQVASGDVGLADLFARHGHRVHHIVVARIFFTAMAFATGWKIEYELFVNIGLAAVTLLVLLGIASDRADRRRGMYGASILTSLLLLSPVQYWNWMWGFSFMLFLINLCVTLGALTLMPERAGRLRAPLLPAAVCCFVATFSMAHGLLSWVALIPSVTYLAVSRGRRAGLIGTWIGAGVIAWLLFFWGYDPTLDAPGARLAVLVARQPLGAIEYPFRLLGTPIASLRHLVGGGAGVWAACGMALVASYCALCAWLLSRPDAALRARAIPWVSIGLFSILYAAMNAVGRATLVTNNAIAVGFMSMYSTPAVLLSVAVVQLGFIARKMVAPQRSRPVLVRAVSSALALLGVCVLSGFVANIPVMLRYRAQSRSREHCFKVAQYLTPHNTCLVLTPARLEDLRALERLGFRRIRRDLTFSEGSGDYFGRIEGVKEHPGRTPGTRRVTFWGRASSQGYREQHPTMFLAPGKGRKFFAHARVDGDHRWRVTIGRRLIPPATSTIRAWAYDPEGGRFVRLGGEVRLRTHS